MNKETDEMFVMYATDEQWNNIEKAIDKVKDKKGK